MIKSSRFWILLIFSLLILAAGIFLAFDLSRSRPVHFDGTRAMQDAATQLTFGPRLPGSEAHRQTVEYIQTELEQVGWQVEIQEAEVLGHPIRNIIARRGQGTPWYILGSHYDSRMLANQDPDPAKQSQPVPGANDGAATTAILLELARVLPANLDKQVWLVFFDAEDQGNIPGWDWILGSSYFAENLSGQPDGVVVVDMVGDADLQIYYERNSTQSLSESIWAVAAEQGFKQFIQESKFTILDDHIPFLQHKIPSTDLIDFDYPYWHTTQDTLDKLSVESLYVVGETLRLWLIEK
jgi:glutaminyl-peptide cyclotransferase